MKHMTKFNHNHCVLVSPLVSPWKEKEKKEKLTSWRVRWMVVRCLWLGWMASPKTVETIRKKNSEDECWQRVLRNLEATELSGCAVTCQSTLVMLVTSFRGETAERRILETYNKKILVPYQNLSELNVQRFCESSGFVATFVFPSCVIFIWRNVTPRSKGCFKWVHCTP